MPSDPITPDSPSSDRVPVEPTPASDGGSSPGNQARPRSSFLSRPFLAGAAAIAVLVIGIGVGTMVARYGYSRQTAAYTLIPPVAISAMTDWSTVAVKGQVAEIFGNKFVLQDDSGRALVETGPQGEDGKLVAKDEAVTVQGRFEHGFLRAAFVVHGDGKTVVIDQPHGPPHHGFMDWLHGHHAAAALPGLPPSPAG